MTFQGVNDLNSGCHFRQSFGAFPGGSDTALAMSSWPKLSAGVRTLAYLRQLGGEVSGGLLGSTSVAWTSFCGGPWQPLTCNESLRDIEACLRAQATKLYHMGLRGTVSRSALADANESRDWRIYAEFAHALIRTARRLYAKDQATPTHQALLWHLRERREDPGLDRGRSVRLSCHRSQAAQS